VGIASVLANTGVAIETNTLKFQPNYDAFTPTFAQILYEELVCR
jgi:hypothetical protein